jgi:AsmA protein
MKRILAAAAVLFVAATMAVGVSPLLVSPKTVRTAVVQHVRALTGRELTFVGEPQVGFRPFLGVTLRDAALSGPAAGDPPLLRADAIRMRIALASVLAGAIRIHGVVLERPRLMLQPGANGQANWQFNEGRLRAIADRMAQARAATAATDGKEISGGGENEPPAEAYPGAILVRDGVVAWAGPDAFEMTGVDAAFDWPRASGIVAAKGAATWRGERFSFEARVDNPLSLAGGGGSAAALKAASSLVELEFKGDANAISDLQLSGMAAARAPSLLAVARLLGADVAADEHPLPLSLSGKLDGKRGNLELRDAALAFGDQQARGALRFTAEALKRPRIIATLAFPGIVVPANGIDAAAGPFALLAQFDADLRISTPSLTLDKFAATDVAAAVTMRDGGVKVDLGNAGFLEGVLAANLTFMRANGAMKLDGKAELAGFSLAAAMGRANAGGISLSGKGKAQGAIRASGRSFAELLDGLRLTSTLQVGAGSLGGIDLAKAEALDAKAAEGKLPAGGATPFVSLAADLSADARRLWIDQALLKGEGITARLSGSADFASRGLAVRIRAGDGDKSARGGLFVGGTLDQPLITRLPRAAD